MLFTTLPLNAVHSAAMLSTTKGFKLQFSLPPKGLRTVRKGLSASEFVANYLTNVGNATHWKTSNFREEKDEDDDIVITLVARGGYENVRFAQGTKNDLHLLMPTDHGSAVAIARVQFTGSWRAHLSLMWKHILAKNTASLPGCSTCTNLPPSNLINQAARVLHDTIGATSDNILASDAKDISFQEKFFVPHKAAENVPDQSLHYLTKAAVTIQDTETVIAGMSVRNTDSGIEFIAEPAANAPPNWRHRAADIAQGWSPARSL